jgi:hypothetical protein
LLEATGVDRCVPAPKVRSDEIGATTEIKKEVDELKKIAFLIVGALLMLGLVLPGCGGGGGGGGGGGPVTYIFTDNEIPLAIVGDVNGPTGEFQLIGAYLAVSYINTHGGVNIGGVVCNFTYDPNGVDTNEAVDLSGETGYTNLGDVIADVDFCLGGFRTEALEYYRDVAMNAHKMFFDCGAATSALCESVVSTYNKYKYFFRGTPYNEYFLAYNVLKMLNYVATEYRVACNMSPDATLTACILAEDLKWSKDELVDKIEAGLPALDITLDHTYIVDSVDTSDTINALGAINATYDPNFLIPVYSGACGVYFDGYRQVLVPHAMSVGINVGAQFKSSFLGVSQNLSVESNPPSCAGEVLLDTWADGVIQTAKTAGFLAGVAAVTYSEMGVAEYPLYTAVTYDVINALKACLHDVGTVVNGTPQAVADNVIAWFENPAKAQLTTTATGVEYYPQPGRTVDGKPALTLAQVESLYDIASYNYTYVGSDWKMPPCNTHDLVFGPGSATGIGAQWQWASTAWKKVGVWPQYDAGQNATRTDQYGNWNFEYTGTVNLTIPQAAINYFYVS